MRVPRAMTGRLRLTFPGQRRIEMRKKPEFRLQDIATGGQLRERSKVAVASRALLSHGYA